MLADMKSKYCECQMCWICIDVKIGEHEWWLVFSLDLRQLARYWETEEGATVIFISQKYIIHKNLAPILHGVVSIYKEMWQFRI